MIKMDPEHSRKLLDIASYQRHNGSLVLRGDVEAGRTKEEEEEKTACDCHYIKGEIL
jgi:hypothetical protein